ncbi:MAG: hypothetical protein NZT92_01315 [Abditibacteriales bacterium]|nr:hypothetical protein [Abditibacteriales bacterium]MDW8364284.1 hypothetical protein [Abditibacteriales bacterium]
MRLSLLSLTDAHLADPAAVAESVRGVKERGNSEVFLRWDGDTRHLLDEAVVTAFQSAVNAAQGQGLNVWLCLDPRQAADVFLQQHPRKQPTAVTYANGRFHHRALWAFDYAALEVNAFVKQLLAHYHRAVPRLHGIWCESPGYPTDDPTVLFVSDDFYREFADRVVTGVFSRPTYDLREKLPCLFEDTPEATRVRCDYFSVWADMVFRVQSTWRTEAARLWGNAIEVGLVLDCGESAAQQLRRGTADYFRFARDTATQVFLKGEASDAALRSALDRSLKKYHPTAPVTSKAHVAVIYNWLTLAALPSPQAEAYRCSLATLAQVLSQRGVAFDIIPPEVLTRATDVTENGGLQSQVETYDAVIYPYPLVHTKPDWETLKFFIESNGRTLLYGPAPRQLVNGASLREEWERLVPTQNWHYVPHDAPQEVADWLVSKVLGSGFEV